MTDPEKQTWLNVAPDSSAHLRDLPQLESSRAFYTRQR